LFIYNSTIAYNTATGVTTGGGVRNNDQHGFPTTTQLRNTIVASNIGGGDLSNIGANGQIVSLGHNLSTTGGGFLTSSGDLSNTDPRLTPLADYGGPTDTHALGCGSPAIDKGDATGAPATD
jgi:hypothetical protein